MMPSPSITTAATPVILAGSRPAVPPLPSVRQIGPQSHRKSSGATCDPLVHPGTHAHASKKSDRIRRLTSTSPTLTPRPNPHSARGTIGAPHPAISCLGAFRTLAAAARGWSWHSGVRKPAHLPTLSPAAILPLFNHLVGKGQQRSWNIDAQDPRSLEIDEQFKLGRLRDR